MDRGMTVKIVRVGNSHGVRIPKPILDQLGISDEAEMRVEEGEIRIRARQKPRQGWEEQFAAMAEAGDDALIDGDWPLTQFEREEWEW